MKKLITLLILPLLVIIFSKAHAAQSVVAVVNSAAITDLDLQNRLQLLSKTNNLPSDSKFLASLKWQVLQMLIDEKLFEQDAKKIGIKIDELEMINAKNIVASNNGLTAAQLEKHLKSAGANIKEFEIQLKHQLIWSKIIKSQIEPNISVTDRELAIFKPSAKNVIPDNSPKGSKRDKVKLAEIVLLNGQNKAKLRAVVEELYSQLQAGADFKQLANDFSQSSTAKKGGEIGWFVLGQLSKEYTESISSINVGEYSRPIELDDQIIILKLLDRQYAESKTTPQKPVTDDQLKDALKQKKIDASVKSYLYKLRKKAYIKINL